MAIKLNLNYEQLFNKKLTRNMESSSESKKVKIAIIGATGAIGKEIVKYAKTHDNISELALVVRKPLEEWKAEDFKCKLKILQLPSFDDLSSLADELENYDVFMCTLGSRTKMGEEEFRRVDYTYPLEFAKLG